MVDLTTELAYGTALVFGALLLTLTYAAKYKHQDHLNRSVLAVLVGALVGLVVRFVIAPANGFDIAAWHARMMSDSTSNKTLQPVVFLFLYPYLYWPSGWFARLDYLCYHIDWLVLMFMGPIVCTIVTTLLADVGHLWWRSLFYSADVLSHYPVSFKDLYVLAACVSFTDPTPLLFAMGDLNVPAPVSVTVLWESLTAPDAATVLVNRALSIDFTKMDFWTFVELSGPGDTLWKDIIPSVLSGMFFGFCMCGLLRTRWLQSRPSWEAIFVLIAPFFSHSAVQSLGLWAILADMPCGLVMSVYGRHQISNEGLRLADNAVTQMTVLICTLYYLFVAAYFAVFSRGLGAILGIWVFLCCIVGRIATIVTCLPVCDIIRRIYSGCRAQSMVENSTESKISRVKLAFLLLGTQTRGGVWFAWYFPQSVVIQKEMVIDAVFTTWLLSQITFGLFPRRMYLWTGLPHGAESNSFDGDGCEYDPIWYEKVIFLRPALWLHNKVLKKVFDLDSDHRNEAESFIDPSWQPGNRWMGAASVLPRRSTAIDPRLSVEMGRRRSTF